MLCGIYKISIGNSFYIGSSKHIEFRWATHKRHMQAGTHNRLVMSAFNKDSNAYYEIVELCDLKSLLEREQYYINHLKPTLNISQQAGRPSGFSKTFMIKDPFGIIHQFSSIKECCEKYKLSCGAVSELLRHKRNSTQGWVRFDDDHKKYPRRGVNDPDNTSHFVTHLRNFCNVNNISYGEMSKVLAGKISHHRGWHLPETTVTHNFNTKYITNGELIISYRHPDEVRTNPIFIQYNLRADSLRCLFKGIISNHRGWTVYNQHQE
jgi:hypothetical protein